MVYIVTYRSRDGRIKNARYNLTGAVYWFNKLRFQGLPVSYKRETK